jgi:hypothetical protein
MQAAAGPLHNTWQGPARFASLRRRRVSSRAPLHLSPLRCIPVSSWLASAGFERYAEAFEAQDISLDVLPELTDADLKELGVATLGDRKRLLKAIAALAPARGNAAPRRRLRP